MRVGLDIKEYLITGGSWHLNIAEGGAGTKPLVLFPGLCASWQWWLPTMREFWNDYRFFAFDLPGAGKAGPIQRVPAAAEMFESVEAALAQLDLEEADGIGHSLGGYLGLLYLIFGGTRVKRFMAVAPGGATQLHIRPAVKLILSFLSRSALLKEQLKRRTLETYRQILPEVSEEHELWIRESLDNDAARVGMGYLMSHTNLIELLPKLRRELEDVPLTSKIRLLWGRYDRVFRLEAGVNLLRSLPGTDLIIFNRSDHWPHYDQPNRFYGEIKRFFN